MVLPVDVNNYNDNSIDRVLVCITAQSNSTRLIESGAHVADKNNGELHILHVQRGDSIFNNENTSQLLEDLFAYGSKKGGMIHMYCDEDISKCIGRFTEEKGITKIVFGQPPMETSLEEKELLKTLGPILTHVPKTVDLMVLPRSDDQCVINIKRN